MATAPRPLPNEARAGAVPDPPPTAVPPPAGRRAVLLCTWLSAAFPIGAYSYSHGLEWAITEGCVTGPERLRSWLVDLFEMGGGWTDAVLVAQAWRSLDAPDELQAIADLAEALAPSRERHLETMAQGEAFLVAVKAGWPEPRLLRFAAARDGRAAYPLAVAVAAAAHGIPLDEVLPSYLNALAAALVSVAVRLVPLGQTSGLKVLAELQPLLCDVAARAGAATLEDLGSACLRSDIASMRHEMQYSRIFRT